MRFLKILAILPVLIAQMQCISVDYVKEVENTDSDLIAYYKLDGNLKDEKKLSDGVFAAGNIKSNKIEHFIDGYDGTPNGAVMFNGTNRDWFRIDLGNFSPVKLGTEGEMTVSFWTYWNGMGDKSP